MQKQGFVARAVDKKYFMGKLEERGKSLRSLAKHLNMDPSGVSRIFSGQRKMQMKEANEIARFLAAPLSEVLTHAGVSVDMDGAPTRILLAAIINERGIVSRLMEAKPLPQAVIDRAQAAISMYDEGSVIAAQIRALEGPLALLDDIVILFRHTDRVENAASGVLSICRSREGEQFLAKIERVRKTGEARVLSATGKAKDVALDTATPILAMIP